MNKKHWYDGSFYSKIIDKGGHVLRNKISRLIKKDSRVIDVACGTGALIFHLQKKCKRLVGVELSTRMHEFAVNKNNYDNVELIHLNAVNLSTKFNKEFDYAIISYVLHEMKPDERLKVLKEMKKISKKIIIIDFAAPLPKSLKTIMIKIVEFIAGKDHYSNHQDFMKNGGVKKLIKKTGLKLKKEIQSDKESTSKIFLCE